MLLLLLHIADSTAFLLLLLPQIADSAPFLLLLLPHIADSVASYGRFESLFDAYAALIMLPFAPRCRALLPGIFHPVGGRAVPPALRASITRFLYTPPCA